MASRPSSDLLWTGFELDGQAFALPAGCVERVLDAGQVTPLPFAPAGVEGVASVSGDVVPVLALATLLFPDRPAPVEPGAQFLVAVFTGQRFALRVDDMLFVAASLSTESENAASWRDRAVTCLDPERLGLATLEPSRPPNGAPGAVANSRDSRAGRDTAPADARVLVVEAAGHPYALPSHAVVELLEQAVITPLPLVPPVFRGAMVVRGQPLLAFCLDRLLGGDGTATPRGHVVLSVGRSRLVLLVDAIVGLQRLPEATSAASPTLLDPEKLITADWLALAAQMPGTAEAAPMVDTRRCDPQ